MGSALKKFRTFVLIVILSVSVVPAASAAPRDGDASRFERITRVIAKFLKHFTVASNSDEVIVPRP